MLLIFCIPVSNDTGYSSSFVCAALCWKNKWYFFLFLIGTKKEREWDRRERLKNEWEKEEGKGTGKAIRDKRKSWGTGKKGGGWAIKEELKKKRRVNMKSRAMRNRREKELENDEGQERNEEGRGRDMRDRRERRWKETRGAMRDRAGDRIMGGGGGVAWGAGKKKIEGDEGSDEGQGRG
jgi:hypothetical protein